MIATIRKWGNKHLGAVTPSGSLAKGTVNRSGTDTFNSTPNTLKEICDTLFNAMNEAGYLLGLARGRRRPW